MNGRVKVAVKLDILVFKTYMEFMINVIKISAAHLSRQLFCILLDINYITERTLLKDKIETEKEQEWSGGLALENCRSNRVTGLCTRLPRLWHQPRIAQDTPSINNE